MSQASSWLVTCATTSIEQLLTTSDPLDTVVRGLVNLPIGPCSTELPARSRVCATYGSLRRRRREHVGRGPRRASKHPAWMYRFMGSRTKVFVAAPHARSALSMGIRGQFPATSIYLTLLTRRSQNAGKARLKKAVWALAGANDFAMPLEGG